MKTRLIIFLFFFARFSFANELRLDEFAQSVETCSPGSSTCTVYYGEMGNPGGIISCIAITFVDFSDNSIFFVFENFKIDYKNPDCSKSRGQLLSSNLRSINLTNRRMNNVIGPMSIAEIKRNFEDKYEDFGNVPFYETRNFFNENRLQKFIEIHPPLTQYKTYPRFMGNTVRELGMTPQHFYLETRHRSYSVSISSSEKRKLHPFYVSDSDILNYFTNSRF